MAGLKPEYIVIHTAAIDDPNCDAAHIDAVHRNDNGWDCIGYHFVILDDRHPQKNDGDLEKGRDINMPGAHVLGLNDRSIGICCVGHGDHAPFTEKQMETLCRTVSELMDAYGGIPLNRVIGHREINLLVAEGVLAAKYGTEKTCPGKMVDMDVIRQAIQNYRQTCD